MHMDRWRFYWKSKSSFPIGSWSCCFSAVYVEMLGALPKPVPQDLQLQTRCQNKNDRRHSWSWWAGCSCEHLLAGKWDETPKTTKELTSPKNSRKKILQVEIYWALCYTSIPYIFFHSYLPCSSIESIFSTTRLHSFSFPHFSTVTWNCVAFPRHFSTSPCENCVALSGPAAWPVAVRRSASTAAGCAKWRRTGCAAEKVQWFGGWNYGHWGYPWGLPQNLMLFWWFKLVEDPQNSWFKMVD